jgi:hypothetical protein
MKRFENGQSDFVKFWYWYNFYEKLSHLNSHSHRAVLMTTLHKILNTFLGMTADDIYLGYHGYLGRGNPSWWRHLPARYLHGRGARAKIIHPDNSEVIGTIRKGQGPNYGERARIVTLCIHFLLCYIIFSVIESIPVVLYMNVLAYLRPCLSVRLL